ncbi:PQQ-binding-like beta-propeller repeat protein [uncultured Nitrospira sp.]|uniref:WD40/YVTN/BNR-like repeat-containing protein n=1 Tax=uncultured Nitrospira sp. TaxID=157176 RepID=UPI0031407127
MKSAQIGLQVSLSFPEKPVNSNSMHGMIVSLGLFWPTVVACMMLAGCGKSEAVVEIALHPTNPKIIYLATNDYIYKSRDGGMIWQNMSAGMTHSRVIALAIDPLFPANIVAGTKGDAVYKSYDGGQRWVSRRTGLDDVTISSVVHQLVFAPGSSAHIFAATSLGVFESDDGGETWSKRMEGMKEVLMVVTLDCDPRQPQTLYAGTSGGVYKSIDGARSWRMVNNGLVASDVLKSSRALGVTRIKVDPRESDTVYTATLSGLYVTKDGGQAWTRIGDTLSDQMLSDLILDHTHPHVVYVTNRDGVFRSEDGGITWEARSAGLTNVNIRALAMSAVDSDMLYVGTNGKGLFRTVDRGMSWKAVPLVVAESLESLS